jgi:hypothetical protein
MKPNFNKTMFIVFTICFLKLAAPFTYNKRWSNEKVVNTATGLQETNISITVLKNSGYITVWESTQQNGDVFAKIYDSNDNVVTADFTVGLSQFQTDSQIYPFPVDLGNQKIVIIWNCYNGTNRNQAKFRIFDYSGNPVTSEIVASSVNSMGFSDQLITRGSANANGYFIVHWHIQVATGDYNARIAFFDPSGNNIKPDFVVNKTTTGYQGNVRSCALKNGNFVVTYHSNQSSNYDIYYNIYDQTGNLLKIDALANTTTAGDENYPFICPLLNGNFVIGWHSDSNGASYDNIIRLFDTNGNAITAEVKANTTVGYNTDVSHCAGLANGNFVVSYSANGGDQDVYYQLFAPDATPILAETKVNVFTTGVQNNAKVSAFQEGSFIFAYNSQNQITNWDTFIQRYDIGNDCKAFSTYAGRNELHAVSFPVLPNTYFKITQLPSTGILMDSINNILNNYNLYTLTTVTNYKTDTTNDDAFYYINYKGDMPCRVDIKACYPSCTACTGIGTIEKHKCSSCTDNYYPLTDNPANCYKSTDNVNGYFFSTDKNVFMPCLSRCSACTTNGDNTNHNCLKCADGYLPLEDQPTQCYKGAEDVVGYYFDINRQQILKCDISCKDCQGLRTSCTGCNTMAEYYPLVEDSSKCLSKLEHHDGFFYVEPIQSFRSCFKTCLTCDTSINDIKDQRCLTCKSEYYPLEDISSNCYLKADKIDYHFWNDSISVFSKCHKSCKTCTSYGTITNPQCISCADGYDTCGPCTQKVYRDTCVSECPELTVYDIVTNTCITCADYSQIYFNSICVDNCPAGYENKEFICKSCTEQKKVYFKGSCYDICPDGYQDYDGMCDNRKTSKFLLI